MKKIITLTIAIVLTTVLQAQCIETVSGFGNNTNIASYNIQGDVDVSLSENGDTITLDLGENFMTASGPDIRAFFVNSGGLSDVQLTNTLIGDLENLQFGLVGSSTTNQNGAKSFTIDIPNDLVIENFDKIFFYCLQFDQFWDFGTFTPFSSANCSILNLDTISLNSFSIAPNPAQDVISIQGIETNDSEIRIFSATGKQIYQNVSSQNNRIDVSNLTAGLYLVSVTQQGNQTTQKLIIE